MLWRERMKRAAIRIASDLVWISLVFSACDTFRGKMQKNLCNIPYGGDLQKDFGRFIVGRHSSMTKPRRGDRR
jgi:hypothetical protein